MTALDAAHLAIEASNMTEHTKASALRLVNLAAANGGQLLLSAGVIGDLLGRNGRSLAFASVRRQLGAMQDSGILMYSARTVSDLEMVMIAFIGWVDWAIMPAHICTPTRDLAHQCANGAHPRATDAHQRASEDAGAGEDLHTGARPCTPTRDLAHQCANGAHPRATDAHQRANGDALTIYPPAGAPVQLDGWMDQPTPVDDIPSIPAAGSQPQQPLTDDQRRTMALLADPEVGVVQLAVRERVARGFPFAEVRRQVAAWWTDSRRRNYGAGWLITSIEERHPCADIGADFRRTPLYLRHQTLAELDAEAEAARQLSWWQEETPAEVVTAAPVDDLAAIWAAAQEAIRHRLPKETGYLLDGTRLLSLNGAGAVIQHPPATADLLRRIDRKILAVLRQHQPGIESISFVSDRSEA